MIETAVLAALMAGVFAVPGLGVVGALRLVRAQRVKFDSMLSSVAERHQLAVVASGLEGVVDEVPVTLAREVWNHAGQSNLPMIVVRAMIVPELDLGLHVRAETMGDAFLDWVASASKTDVETGDARFDVPFRVAAHEAERARALLDVEIRAAAIRLPADGFFEVDDRLVRLAVPYELDGERAAWAIETAVWFAKALGESARQVPPAPTVKPHLPAYRKAAEVLGLELSETPAALRGSLEGVEVCVQLARKSATESVSILWAPFPLALGLGLDVRPQQGGLRALFAARDIELGDGRFDAAFVVRGNDESSVRRLLDEPIRRALLELRERGSLVLDDRGLRLELAGVVDPRDVVPTLRELRDVACGLVERVGRARSAVRGAYR
jgi:hypothetical protein